MKHQFFSLYSNCIPVSGLSQAIIYDLQFHRYKIIPKLLHTVLNIKGKTVYETKKEFHNKYDLGIDQYYTKLADEGFGFFTNEPEYFPEIELSFAFPGIISNAIIDIDIESNFDFSRIFNELQICGCDTVQLRFYFSVKLMDLNLILTHLVDSSIKSVEILVPFSSEFTKNNINEFVDLNKRIRKIIFHKWDVNQNQYHIDDVILFFLPNEIDYINDCGYIEKSEFVTNFRFFTEALHFNTCLHKKVSINTKGEIMNCPSLNIKFGNIDSASILNVVKSKKFQQLWHINKDKVHICKHCEYRYMCSDCRAFRSSESIYSKPSKCTYNPHKRNNSINFQ